MFARLSSFFGGGGKQEPSPKQPAEIKKKKKKATKRKQQQQEEEEEKEVEFVPVPPAATTTAIPVAATATPQLDFVNAGLAQTRNGEMINAMSTRELQSEVSTSLGEDPTGMSQQDLVRRLVVHAQENDQLDAVKQKLLEMEQRGAILRQNQYERIVALLRSRVVENQDEEKPRIAVSTAVKRTLPSQQKPGIETAKRTRLDFTSPSQARAVSPAPASILKPLKRNRFLEETEDLPDADDVAQRILSTLHPVAIASHENALLQQARAPPTPLPKAAAASVAGGLKFPPKSATTAVQEPVKPAPIFNKPQPAAATAATPVQTFRFSPGHRLKEETSALVSSSEPIKFSFDEEAQWKCASCGGMTSNTFSSCSSCFVKRGVGATAAAAAAAAPISAPPPAAAAAPASGDNNNPFSRFKLKADQWQCPSCNVKNSNDQLVCPCCETEKPAAATATALVPAAPVTAVNDNNNPFSRFKLKADQWQCPSCNVKNSNDQQVCPCCEHEKPNGSQQAPVATGVKFASKQENFVFGSSSPVKQVPETPTVFRTKPANEESIVPPPTFSFAPPPAATTTATTTNGLFGGESKPVNLFGGDDASRKQTDSTAAAAPALFNADKPAMPAAAADKAVVPLFGAAPPPAAAPSLFSAAAADKPAPFSFGAAPAAAADKPAPFSFGAAPAAAADKPAAEVPSLFNAAAAPAADKPAGAVTPLFGLAPAPAADKPPAGEAATSLFSPAAEKPASAAVNGESAAPSSFGGSGNTTTTAAASTFGAPQPATTAPTQTSAFGGFGSATTAVAAAPSLFGGPTAEPAKPATSSSVMFDSAPSFAFGGAGSSGDDKAAPVPFQFGGSSSSTANDDKAAPFQFGAAQPTPTPSVPSSTPPPTLFGQQAPTSSMFGQQPPTATASTQPLFGQPPATPAQTMFGQPAAPAAPPLFGQQQAPAVSSTFGQPPSTAAPAAPLFGQPPAAAAPATTGGFAFGNSGPAAAPQFGGQQQQAPPTFGFGQQQPQPMGMFGQQQAPPPSGTPGFGSASPSPAFGQPPQQQFGGGFQQQQPMFGGGGLGGAPQFGAPPPALGAGNASFALGATSDVAKKRKLAARPSQRRQ